MIGNFGCAIMKSWKMSGSGSSEGRKLRGRDAELQRNAAVLGPEYDSRAVIKQP